MLELKNTGNNTESLRHKRTVFSKYCDHFGKSKLIICRFVKIFAVRNN